MFVGVVLQHSASNTVSPYNSILLLIHHRSLENHNDGLMAFTPQQWPAREVRNTFLNFFKKKGHTFGNHPLPQVDFHTLTLLVPLFSFFPHNDPSLLFTNDSMNQYKSIFLSTLDPHSDFAQLKCATNSQKCIRAGGKHNDLDNVGKDSYHHSFFEMLGNWSLTHYFKKEAIEISWELLVKVHDLDPDRIYVTYFEGDAASGIGSDDEAYALWCKDLVNPALNSVIIVLAVAATLRI